MTSSRLLNELFGIGTEHSEMGSLAVGFRARSTPDVGSSDRSPDSEMFREVDDRSMRCAAARVKIP